MLFYFTTASWNSQHLRHEYLHISERGDSEQEVQALNGCCYYHAYCDKFRKHKYELKFRKKKKTGWKEKVFCALGKWKSQMQSRNSKQKKYQNVEGIIKLKFVRFNLANWTFSSVFRPVIYSVLGRWKNNITTSSPQLPAIWICLVNFFLLALQFWLQDHNFVCSFLQYWMILFKQNKLTLNAEYVLWWLTSCLYRFYCHILVWLNCFLRSLAWEDIL